MLSRNRLPKSVNSMCLTFLDTDRDLIKPKCSAIVRRTRNIVRLPFWLNPAATTAQFKTVFLAFLFQSLRKMRRCSELVVQNKYAQRMRNLRSKALVPDA